MITLTEIENKIKEAEKLQLNIENFLKEENKEISGEQSVGLFKSDKFEIVYYFKNKKPMYIENDKKFISENFKSVSNQEILNLLNA